MYKKVKIKDVMLKRPAIAIANVIGILAIAGGIFYYINGHTLISAKEGFFPKQNNPEVKGDKDSLGRELPSRKNVSDNANSEEDILTLSSRTGISPLSGISCTSWDKRPIAVMYSGDLDARQQLKNLSEADVVLEMRHRALYGQPRLMGVFQCKLPQEAGPMRSGRMEFLSVADSLDAIFVPWGGSSVVKTLLKENVADYVDCNGEMAFNGAQTSACYTDESITINSAEPAFSNIQELIKLFDQYKYRTMTNFNGFSFGKEIAEKKRPEFGQVNVKFEQPYRVKYLYDKETNSYKRYYGDQPHIDAATQKQFAPKNIVTIITKMDAWNKDINYERQGLKDPWKNIDAKQKIQEHGQYPNFQLGDAWFDTAREGPARFFINGEDIKGYWKREKGESKPFVFYNKDQQKIQFVPGQMWIHVLSKERKVSYYEEPKEK